MDFHPWMYPVLFSVGLVAGTVDSIAGGGGLLTLPALLSICIPAPFALGTNKFQASFGSTSAAWHYSRAGLVHRRGCIVGVVFTAIGALVGSSLANHLSPALLQRLIPALLVVVLVYTLARPEAGLEPHRPKVRASLFFGVVGLILGFYDGFLGPGTGSFWTLLIISFLGFEFLRATAATKVMNATSNLAGLALFLLAGKVQFQAGLIMAAGQLIGAKCGTYLAVRGGAQFVRPMFLCVVAALLARLVFVQFS